jgi:hypothetical protein
MDKPVYNLKSSSDKLRFFFESKGVDSIQKAIIYFPLENSPKMHELTFGDVTNDGFIDFLNVSNNNDLPIIMTTVIESINIYFKEYPNNTVFFRGSTPSRTRLYRAVIAKEIERLQLSLQVFGLTTDNLIEVFDKTFSYTGYLIQKNDEKEI